MFLVFSHFTFHLCVSVHEFVLGEDGFEPCRAVLLGVVAGFSHAPQYLGALAVLVGRDLFEVVERPIHLVTVDVVDLHTFGTRSDPCLPHEMVAAFAAEMAHAGVRRVHVWTVVLRARGVDWFDLVEGSTVVGEGEKVPVSGAVESRFRSNRSPVGIRTGASYPFG